MAGKVIFFVHTIIVLLADPTTLASSASAVICSQISGAYLSQTTHEATA